MTRHVFVSYSRRDSAYVKELVAHLRAAGVTVWIDESLEPGTPVWVRTVEKAIEECVAFVPVMTSASLASAWVDREIDFAQELNKPILPLLVEGRRLLRLRDIQTEDVTGGHMPRGAFVARLHRLAGGPSVGSPLVGGPSVGSPSVGSPSVGGPPVALAAAEAGRATAPSANLLRTLVGHSSAVVSVAWSPDGRLLATGSDDKTARVWNAATATTLHTLGDHTKRVASVSWSPDGSRLATGSDDGTARFWDPASGVAGKVLKPDGYAFSVDSMAWSPDGRTLATGGFDGVRVWDVATGATRHTLSGHDDPVVSVAWSPDGRCLATGSWDKTAKIWDAAAGTIRCTLSGHAEALRAVAWSPDARLVATASHDGTIRLWAPARVTTIRTLEGHSQGVTWVGWSPDGGMLASVSGDHTLRLWDPDTGAGLVTVTVSSTAQTGFGRFWSGDRNALWAAGWSPDGRQIATASQDGAVRIWALSGRG